MTSPDHETPRPGSIIDREQKWVAAQSVADLRQTVYMKLPPVIAANDLEGRKPFLALDALVGLLRQTEQERDDARDVVTLLQAELFKWVELSERLQGVL